MADRYWQARFSLVVCGEELPFDEISGRIGMQPTRIVRRGDILNRLPEVHAQDDEWFYTIPLTAPDDEDHELNELLGNLIERKEALKSLEGRFSVMMRLYIRSDKAVIAYRLMPETLEKLNAIGVPLDVTSLSWGDIGI